MNRLISFIILIAFGVSAGADQVDDATKNALLAHFRATDTKLREMSEAYRGIADASSANPIIETLDRPAEPLTYSLDGQFLLHTRAEGPRLRLLVNTPLSRELAATRRSQAIPGLGIQDAIEHARRYLDQFGVRVNEGLELTTCAFNATYRYSWEVRWTRVTNGYPWDDFLGPYLESVVVVFHEKRGLYLMGNDIYSPIPKSLDVRVSREEAIEKASRSVSAVERTPFYGQARESGFEPIGLKSCDLKIAIPNWLLDPVRAVWVREKPPEETRLCWIVMFSTVDARADARGLNQDGKPMKLVPPEILIYIDAGSGEVVGANFT